MKRVLIQDQFYIGLINDRPKGGKTGNVYDRFGTSQYNVGSTNNVPSYVYFAIPSVVFPIDRLEELYKREFADYLIPSKNNFRKLTEFIDPKFSHITVDVIKVAMESFIKLEKLPVKRLKKDYLFTCQLDRDFVDKVRADPEKYLEEI